MVRAALRQTLRSLLRAPLFTGGAVLTLALGIGAAAATFSILDGVLLRPLPYLDASRLVVLRHSLNGLGIPDAGQSLGTYYFYRHTSRTLASVAGWRAAAVNLADAEGRADAERVDGASVSINLFSTLGVAPERGRVFATADERDSAHVVVIAHDLWARRFGGNPAVVGSDVRVDGVRYTIIGVMPDGFHYPYATTSIWRPLLLDSITPHAGGFNIGGLARLAPGATATSAQAELNRLLPRLPSAYPDVYPVYPMPQFLEQSKLAAVVRPMREAAVAGYARPLWIVFGTVGLLVLAAVTNVGTLMLVRAQGRVHEFAVRTALGSSRRRLAGRWFAESALLTGAACALGLGVAAVLTSLFVHYGPSDFPYLRFVHFDLRTVVFAVALAIGVAVVCGALPALRFGTVSARELLGAGGRTASMGRGQQRAQRALTVVQVALAVVLLGGAALLARSVKRIAAVAPGFDPNGVLAFTISLPAGQYRTDGDVARFYTQALAAIQTLPGVTDAGITSKLPLVGGETLGGIYVEGVPVKANAVPPVFPTPVVNAGYFRAMRIGLIGGRLFRDPGDAEGAHDVVVSRAFAERYWSSPAQAIGHRVRMETLGPWQTIVGVVQSVRDTSLTAAPVAEVYLPLRVVMPGAPDTLAAPTPRVATVVVRASGVPSALANGVRRAIHALDASVPVYGLQPLDAIVSQTTARTRFVLLALVAAALITVLLGMVGLYGVIAYSVTFRRREMGVRLALGAKPTTLLAVVLRDGVLLAVAGLALGLVAYAGAARVLRVLLFEASPADPLTVGGLVVLSLIVAVAASFAPAWRAARTDPVEALRGE